MDHRNFTPAIPEGQARFECVQLVKENPRLQEYLLQLKASGAMDWRQILRELLDYQAR